MRVHADMISEFIREDAGLGDDQAHLLGIGLVGMAQVSATYWLSTDRAIPKDAAEQLDGPAGLARYQRLAADRLSGCVPALYGQSRAASAVSPAQVATRVASTFPKSPSRSEHRSTVEVKIGIQNIPRELVVETNVSAQDLERALTQAMTSEDGGLFVLPDDKGGKFLIPAGKIAYVELSDVEQRRVGFASH